MKEKYSDSSSDQYKKLCKTNSISKRTCDSTTMVNIFMDKYTILTTLKTASKYRNKKGYFQNQTLKAIKNDEIFHTIDQKKVTGYHCKSGIKSRIP